VRVMATHAAEVRAGVIRRIPGTFDAGIVGGQDTLDEIVGGGPIIRETSRRPVAVWAPGGNTEYI